MNALAAFAAGLVFGIGLILSGMTDPGKVIGFLDLAGRWDPSLAFVMAGAILVGFAAFIAARRGAQPVLGGDIRLPAVTRIDRRLILGSLVFGVGWGLAGFCPAPALLSLGTSTLKALTFVLGMLAGMALYELAERKTGAAGGNSAGASCE